MLEFMIDNIYVVCGDQAIQQPVRISMGISCALLLTDLLLYSYEAEFIPNLVKDKNRTLAVALNSTFN